MKKSLTKGIQSLLILILQGAKTTLLFTLTPKDLGLPYVGFSDSGQAAVNSFYF
jgi:hypothetical protein